MICLETKAQNGKKNMNDYDYFCCENGEIQSYCEA